MSAPRKGVGAALQLLLAAGVRGCGGGCGGSRGRGSKRQTQQEAAPALPPTPHARVHTPAPAAS